MTDQTQFLVSQAMVAIKAGDLEGGRKLLESVLELDPDHEKAWLWMSAAVKTDDERRHCLEEVLRINPDNSQAIRGLEKLSPPAATEAKPTKADFQDMLAKFAAFEEPEGGQATSEPETEGTPPFTWPLEPEQRDLAAESSTGDTELDALFKKFDSADEAAGSEAMALEWDFEEPLEGSEGSTEVSPLSGEEALDRFLGVEPPSEKLRGFYEEDARQGKVVPAFTMDEDTQKELEAAKADGSIAAFTTGELEDDDSGFDLADLEGGAAEPVSAAPTRAAIASGMLILWPNPDGKISSVVILKDEYLILANPDPLFIGRIREEALRGEVKRRSLGRTARAILLKNIERVAGEPEGNTFKVTYRKDKKRYAATAEFASSVERDDAMAEIATQLGMGFQTVTEEHKRSKLIWAPLLVMILALIAAPGLIYLSFMQLGIPTSWNEPVPALIIPIAIGVVGLMIFLMGLVWLMARGRVPLHQVAIVPSDELGL